jgi:hypothetical protein
LQRVRIRAGAMLAMHPHEIIDMARCAVAVYVPLLLAGFRASTLLRICVFKEFEGLIRTDCSLKLRDRVASPP